ncbi:DUF4837 family protein [Abyssalbus ytuae]|uniref:DUF4837 family protein n=1 Tax=Abyssalbus ytuae TaxID=2926907 RepID=A0A9E6ZP02_9FLAO|nr:DUF4837 family protein [Abyssalbus ytuae]UOB19397.1 DUF4837 family protein [Abyssalbus ytuae]
MKKIFILIALVSLITACKKGESKRYVPDSVGGINSLSVVMDDDLWKGEVGDAVRKHFAASIDAFPWWDEPIFKITQMQHSVFNGFARLSRNILIVQKDSVMGTSVKDSLYAQPQKTLLIQAPTEEELISLINKNADDFVETIRNHELKEQKRRIALSLNKDEKLEKILGIKLRMPSVYKVVKEEGKFLWLEKQIQKGTMNILAYEMPLNSIPNDSTKVEAIVKMRDSIGEKFIPGREEGMYMITEKAFAPLVFDAKIDGKPAIEAKGLWEVKNFMMAGPFINYIIEDKKNNRLVVVEGFTFAPSTNKRDFMFELEAILTSLKFLN